MGKAKIFAYSLGAFAVFGVVQKVRRAVDLGVENAKDIASDAAKLSFSVLFPFAGPIMSMIGLVQKIDKGKVETVKKSPLTLFFVAKSKKKLSEQQINVIEALVQNKSRADLRLRVAHISNFTGLTKPYVTAIVIGSPVLGGI